MHFVPLSGRSSQQPVGRSCMYPAAVQRSKIRRFFSNLEGRRISKAPVNAYKSLVPKVQNKLYMLEVSFKQIEIVQNVCTGWYKSQPAAMPSGTTYPCSVIAEYSMFFVQKPFFIVSLFPQARAPHGRRRGDLEKLKLAEGGTERGRAGALLLGPGRSAQQMGGSGRARLSAWCA